jgi:hypothetical protein
VICLRAVGIVVLDEGVLVRRVGADREAGEGSGTMEQVDAYVSQCLT